MKPFFKELLQYNHYFNQAVITVLTDNPEKISEKCSKLLSHILNVHQIWNLKIQPGEPSFDSWEVHEIQGLKDIDRKNFEFSNHLLETHELTNVIKYATKNGQFFANNIQDILFQIINHSNYHRAQIATEFRQCGLEPILTDYIYYKMIKGM
jgi:uncharacterized damage-inducible protein DinB